ncbi:hypothetical protein RFI_21999 [Reticulomyxa filosa]|uniref:G domain-containing protein n=1 Tax=Reticulomyxa filosa TaxID=46433 RepID=X6MP10_RETFI|nr:hypothetical protein RFI_21999 [Reticulomyxa filosa]|eukprot:ETO15366.1 hypothetical protein RFI_21999 [Reticulomyxa filosa]
MVKTLLENLRKQPVVVRQHFAFPTQINWYPGHMSKAMRQLKEHFYPRTHIILEVRDARIPISSEHPMFKPNERDEEEQKYSMVDKPRLVLFNKADILGLDRQKTASQYFVFVTCETKKKKKSEKFLAPNQKPLKVKSVKRNYVIGKADKYSRSFGKLVVGELQRLCKEHEIQGSANVVKNVSVKMQLNQLHKQQPQRVAKRSKRQTKNVNDDDRDDDNDDDIHDENDDDEEMEEREMESGHSKSALSSPTSPIMVAVMGYPNTGKSTVINALRALHHRKDSAVMGKRPGVTKHISYFKLSSDPVHMFLLDTPGIFVPNVQYQSLA